MMNTFIYYLHSPRLITTSHLQAVPMVETLNAVSITAKYQINNGYVKVEGSFDCPFVLLLDRTLKGGD